MGECPSSSLQPPSGDSLWVTTVGSADQQDTVRVGPLLSQAGSSASPRMAQCTSWPPLLPAPVLTGLMAQRHSWRSRWAAQGTKHVGDG